MDARHKVRRKGRENKDNRRKRKHIRASLVRRFFLDRSRDAGAVPAAWPSVVDVERLRPFAGAGAALAGAPTPGTFGSPALWLIAGLFARVLGPAAGFGAGFGAGLGLLLFPL